MTATQANEKNRPNNVRFLKLLFFIQRAIVSMEWIRQSGKTEQNIVNSLHTTGKRDRTAPEAKQRNKVSSTTSPYKYIHPEDVAGF